jgi:uncharacterized membrane protein
MKKPPTKKAPRLQRELDEPALGVAKGPSTLQMREADILEIVEEHSGPIPSAAALERYDRILPGTANRVVTMAENSQAHEIFLGRSDVLYRLVGLIAGIGFALLLILSSIWFGFQGNIAMAALLLGAAALGVVGKMIDGRMLK